MCCSGCRVGVVVVVVVPSGLPVTGRMSLSKCGLLGMQLTKPRCVLQVKRLY